MTKPTYHYDKHGRMIHESDYVRCNDGNEGRVEWIGNQWELISEREGDPQDSVPLNLYSKDQLEIV